MTPKLSKNQKLEIKENIEKSCPTTLLDLKTVFEPYPDLKNSPLGLQKVQNNPKIRSNSKVRIEGIKVNESCSTT